MKPVRDRRNKVQSVEVGMRVLIALSQAGRSAPLLRIARATEMPASKVHRYLQALIASGFVAQDPSTGYYQLGPEALAIGFAAIGHLDIVHECHRPLADLRDRIDETCLLAIWANKGVTVIRIEPASRSVVVNIRIGSVLPMLTSASGLVFAAFQNDPQTRRMIDEERGELRRKGYGAWLLRAERGIAKARATKLAVVTSMLTPGVTGISAPVFDYQGKIAGAFTALGPSKFFDATAGGSIARELAAAARRASELLGSRLPATPVTDIATPSRRPKRG